MKTVHSIVIIFLFLGIFSQCFGQGTTMPKYYAAIEKDRQQSFQARLSALIKAEAEGDFVTLYDLLARDQKIQYKSLEDFISSRRANESTVSWNLVEFKPKEIVRILMSNEYLVYGCGKYTLKDKNKSFRSQVTAVDENGRWNFQSIVGISLKLGSQVPSKCR